MKYETIKFEIEEHKNRKWVIWVSRDGKRFMLGSGISSEEEAVRMIGSMKIERKYYQKKIDPEVEKLKRRVEELEQYKFKYDCLSKALNSISETNSRFNKNSSYNEPNSLF